MVMNRGRPPNFICPSCLNRTWPTRDHILPRSAGGVGIMHGDTINIRKVCAKCNSMRACAGDCHVPVVLAHQIARETNCGIKTVSGIGV
jgi:hypothetical protein